MITENEIAKAFENTNFGPNPDHKKIILDTLLKLSVGFGVGKTARMVCEELGLLTKSRKPSAKGRAFMMDNYGLIPVVFGKEEVVICESCEKPVPLEFARMDSEDANWFCPKCVEEANEGDVPEGYYFTNEHAREVTVLATRNGWCLVSEEGKDKPYVLAEEFVLTIKKESEEARGNDSEEHF